MLMNETNVLSMLQNSESVKEARQKHWIIVGVDLTRQSVQVLDCTHSLYELKEVASKSKEHSIDGHFKEGLKVVVARSINRESYDRAEVDDPVYV